MSVSRSSPVPLWLTLGFATGLAFGWMAFRQSPPSSATTKSAAVTQTPPPERAEIPVNAGTLRAVEQAFERWGGYAVWENDVTEIAAWDARRQRHADFYEVRRHERKFYFRSLQTLTRPIIDHGVSATIPIAFTEPQWVRDQFYREHPDYDPATAPRLALPPRPPERSETRPSSAIPPASATIPTPGYGQPNGFNAPPLTPGAGG